MIIKNTAANDMSTYLTSALQHQAEGDNWQAMSILKQLSEEHSASPLFHKLLGNTYFHMGLLDWAIDSYNQAIKLDPKYIDARYDLGVALYHHGRITKAISEYQDVLHTDPDYHAAHYRIGLCYKQVGRFGAAIHHLLEAIAVTPEYVMAYFHLGEIYFEQEEYDKAKMSFRRLLREEPGHASSNYLRLIESRSGKLESTS